MESIYGEPFPKTFSIIQTLKKDNKMNVVEKW